MCRAGETPLELIDRALALLPEWAAQQTPREQGQLVLRFEGLISRLKAASAEAIRRFDRAQAYKADGTLGTVPWLQANARLAGNEAAQQVKVARQLGELPRTEEALARGEIGYGHALALAVSAERIGAAAVRQAEASLLQSAESMDAGRFVAVMKDFEHRVDADAALSEANWAHQRRYLTISGPFGGTARIQGQLIPEAAAIIRSAMEPFMKPSKNDDRNPGQRAHDALMEVCQRVASGRSDGAAPRPQLIVRTSIDTLAAIPGAPGGELESGGIIPAETVRRLACESAVTRITGLGELEMELTHASRTTPPATRRALDARDRHCVFPSCDRPVAWCQSHHLFHWADGGPTALTNLCLLCTAHHRKVHEEGWRLERKEDQWVAIPPPVAVIPRGRSG